MSYPSFGAPTTYCAPSTGGFLSSSTTDGDECEMEYSLDFQGRKHANTCDLDYHGYTMQIQPFVSCDTFAMPGSASANGLRNYLRKHLQPHQITDEYGDECDISEVSFDHLAVLQSKIWTQISRTRSPIKPTAQHPSRAQICVLNHITKISQLLEKKHVFVSNGAATVTCQYLGGIQATPFHTCSSQVVRLEPLVHWGTITPATMSQSIFLFNRKGELMKQPEYLTLVRRVVDTEAPAYCIKCLEYLWTKCLETRDIMKHLQHRVEQPERSRFEEVSRPQSRLKTKEFGIASCDNKALAGTKTDKTGYYTRPSETVEEHENFGTGIPQFDGASDYVEKHQTRHAPCDKQHHDTMWISSDSDNQAEECVRPTNLGSHRNSFVLPLRTTPTSSESPDKHRPSFATELPMLTLRSVATKTSSALKAKSFATSGRKQDKSKQEIIDLITPPRIKQRKFGQQIDANVKGPLVPLRRSPRNHSKDVSTLKENLLHPVPPMKPLVARLKKTVLTELTKKRKVAIVLEQTSTQKKPRTISSIEPELQQSDLPGAPRTEIPPMVKPEPPVEAPTPPPLVHFAKRSATMAVPEGVATLTHEAFRKTSPAPNTKICVCGRAAGFYVAKKNARPQIAQCNNLDCRFQWYHYACLGQSDKGKARFGNLVCKYCLTEQELAALRKTNNVSMEKPADFKMPWTKQDIETDFPGLGGHVPVTHPYGLGMDADTEPVRHTETQSKGTLGALEKFGYVQSHPGKLEQAYLHSRADARLLAGLPEEEVEVERRQFRTRPAKEELDEYYENNKYDENGEYDGSNEYDGGDEMDVDEIEKGL
ncbi:hypothetical protein OPT61_g6163 [Boeremia exigua]|uniref:Uncharacterized protein n=1 Tax=Boeremia exigua TaxID=749465 RepID=A0ACC2I7N1_9PLEO|nr:hypothetical protein OPT61_g6163 [Boeremia exigua]